MHLNIRRKVRLNFSIDLNYIRKTSILFLFSFFSDLSWPATEGKVRSFQKNDVRNYLQSYSLKRFDMAAVNKLKAQKAIGMQIDIKVIKFKNHITLDELKLAVMLNGVLQLLHYWANLHYVIQTSILTLIFCRRYNFYFMLWHATQGSSSNFFQSSPN
jgi:hypothetical protein